LKDNNRDQTGFQIKFNGNNASVQHTLKTALRLLQCQKKNGCQRKQ